jgi:hypothetical protein
MRGRKVTICMAAYYIFSTNFFHSSLNSSDLVKWFTGTQNWETAHRLVLVITICLPSCASREGHEKNEHFFFCFSATSGTLYKELGTFYCYRRHKCRKSIVVQNSIFIYTRRGQWHVAQQHTQNAFLPSPCNSGSANAPHGYVIRALPVLIIFRVTCPVLCTPLELSP